MALFSDGEILQQLKECRPQAFRVLFDTFYEPLCLQAALLLHDQHQADDVVQQVFVRFWEQRRYEQVQGSLAGYLRTMVKNDCFDLLKNRQKQQARLADYSHLIPEISDEDLLEMKELSKLMQQAIDELPEHCRQIFISTCLEGKKYKEVADEKKISVNTVKEQLRRAFRKMREKMRDIRYIF